MVQKQLLACYPLSTSALLMRMVPLKLWIKVEELVFWDKLDNSNKPKSLAAWDLLCRPKSKDSLGNLAAHNEALLFKFLPKIFNKENIPWVHLIWRSYYNSTPQAFISISSGGETSSNYARNSKELHLALLF